jgi:hypothetical protein
VARVGLSITKSTSFRNSTQEFSNVYYYFCGATLPSETDANALIDAVKALEVGFHSTDVTFVRGRVWSQEGSPGANNMISQKNLSGTGSRTGLVTMDKERAFLVRWRAGNDSRGQAVYLRKWYHSCGLGPGAVTPDTGTLQQTSGFTQTQRDAVAAAVESVKSLTVNGIAFALNSKAGRGVSIGETAKCHNFLEHHQFGDMWRAQ